MYKTKYSHFFCLFVTALVFCVSCISTDKISKSKEDVALRKIASREPTHLFASGFNCEQRKTDTSIGTDLHRLVIKGGFSSSGLSRRAMREGADVNAIDSLGRTPLHWASWCSKSGVALTLIQNGADVNIQDNNGNTPLHLAARPDRVPVRVLVESILEAKTDIGIQNKDGDTPMHLLAVNNDYKNTSRAIIKLSQYIAGFDALDIQNNLGYTPLHLVIKNLKKDYSLSLIDALIEVGHSVDVVSMDGHAPISMAISNLNQANHGDVAKVAKTLIDAGANVNFKHKDGDSLLHILLAKLRAMNEWGVAGAVGIIERLVDAKIVVDSIDRDGNTPLHLAVGSNILGSRPVVRELIRGRATLNARGKGGNTPLHLAAMANPSKNTFESIELLVKEGANIKIRNDDGLYPFQMINIEFDENLRGYKKRIYNLLYFDIEKH